MGVSVIDLEKSSLSKGFRWTLSVWLQSGDRSPFYKNVRLVFDGYHVPPVLVYRLIVDQVWIKNTKLKIIRIKDRLILSPLHTDVQYIVCKEYEPPNPRVGFAHPFDTALDKLLFNLKKV